MKDQEPRYKLKLITNVGDFGLLTALAKTRLRLVGTALLLNGGLFALTTWVASYVNEASSSVGLNLVLITSTMLLLLVTSYVEAMLLGDLFFQGDWRKRVLLGQKPQEDSTNPHEMAAQHRNYNLHFLIVLALTIVGNYYGTRALTGDYLDRYHQLGFHLTRLRAEDFSEKEAALKDLSKTLYRDRWHKEEVKAALVAQLDSPEPELQRWAIFIAGQAHYDDVFNRLVGFTHSGEPLTRQEAAQALGAMNDTRAVTPLLALLLDKEAPREVTLGALRGLGTLRAKGVEAGPTILTLLRDTQDDETRAHAAWALGQIAYKEAYPELWKLFDASADDDGLRCAAMEGLKYLSQHASEPNDVRRAKDLFTEIKPHECPYVIWEDRHEEKIYIMYKEFYRTKLLKLVANRVGRQELEWFQFVAADQENPYPVRLQATEISRLLK